MASSSFFKAHEFTAKWEGGLTDHPNDRGGITAYGVSYEFASGIARTTKGSNFLASIGVSLPISRQSIRDLTKKQAAQIFRHEFWDKLNLDALPYRQAAILYDAAVNHGPKRAVILSQRGFNKSANANWRRLDEDGIIGPKTRAALRKDTDALCIETIQARRDFYHAIVRNDATQKVFLKGWLNRANALEAFILTREPA